MTPRFFIDRPVFAWVIALGILLSGIIAVRGLPIEQYPSVAPPSLSINVTYPGADASTLEQNVTQVIEQELNGIEGFLYMASNSLSNGTASITLTFAAGTDIDRAQMDVQNRLRRVEQRLPEDVRRQGISVTEANAGFLMIVALTSKTGQMSSLEIGNFANTKVVDELRRVGGVGNVQSFSPGYAMRIWLDPDRLASFGLSPAEVLGAVQEQNSQTPGGQLGDQPVADGSELNAIITTQGRFTTPEQFRAIILRANGDGSSVTLGDVARVELGAENYIFSSELNGKPMAGMAVQLTPGANALATAEGVNARMEELAQTFPQDVAWSIPYDTTPFVEISVEEVIITLVEAMILVFIVMFLFLQNWRATLIPSIVVPIALAGACLGLWMAGFSINVLTLFGMVLAIGILVDDAIVVIENVERIMRDEKLPPYEATVKAMSQITSPIIGITLVLIAVFVPMAFFPGTTGGIYRQFSLTLAISIAFSALLALTLTPALCASFLKPHEESERSGPVGQRVDKFFGRFNGWFARTTDRYQGAVGAILGRPLRWMIIVLALIGVTAILFTRLPGSFLPQEDQGYLITVIQAPPGATTERTNLATAQVRDYFMKQEQTANTVLVRGFSFFGQGQNNAIVFTPLKPWDERPGTANRADSLAGQAMGVFGQIKEAFVFSLSPPAIQELGNASGWTFKLQDRGGNGYAALNGARGQMLGAASQSKVLQGVRPEEQQDAPQLRVDIDRLKARALGLSIADVNATLAINFGSAYANDFTRDGRVLRVLMLADAPYRMTPEDINKLRVRSATGDMVPFGSFSRASWTAGAPQLHRYNGYPAMTISGEPAPGYSTGEAMAEMEKLAEQLPPGFAYEWTGISYEEQQSSGQIGLLLGLSMVVVFLLLAALYESWAVPVAVLLVVPIGVLGAVLLSTLRGFDADIYFNVGLITIIGLSAKNAILIVEFAIEQEAEGKSTFHAVMEAVKLRLRPIIMTSLAFIAGMIPLVIASGAGAAGRRAVGTGVMGGMLSATFLGIFFIPLFYLVVRKYLTKRRPPSPHEKAHMHDPPATGGEGAPGHA